MGIDDAATEWDVALDILAALDAFEGLVGSESTTIDSAQLSLDDERTVELLLSNGQRFTLRVREA